MSTFLSWQWNEDSGKRLTESHRKPKLRNRNKRTFGSLLKELSGSSTLNSDLGDRLLAILAERNWLVHRSRRDNRGVLRLDDNTLRLVAKLDRITAEALDLLRIVGALIEEHAINSGVSADVIDEESERLLREWGSLE